MNRHLAAHIAPFTLAAWLCAAVPSLHAQAAAPAPAPATKEDAAEAQTLKAAEAKLAALAREVESGKPAAQVSKKTTGMKSAAGKLKKHDKRGKVARKSNGKGNGKGAVAVKAKVLERRMTQAEVQGVLAGSRDFAGADLSGLNLTGYDLTGAKFNRANLQSVNLERADLSETDLELADLTGANLRGASLNQARIRGTRLAGAKLDGAMWTDKTICRAGSVGNCIE
ncbi:pentapeptide repeat-containing protein [Geomonas azotofigens]|uniref:pentapeptide repeat-containing protein n=1 Tax=Geomonas azotofigens TaxID=2843196 RepID=UPI001C10B331|nr:pentapeptide repeat-containing protein [Geomonas azotofigens]MBU5611991.1 pentapeptide repeat-containing protein [Geomonas azotofigens]